MQVPALTVPKQLPVVPAPSLPDKEAEFTVLAMFYVQNYPVTYYFNIAISICFYIIPLKNEETVTLVSWHTSLTTLVLRRSRHMGL